MTVAAMAAASARRREPSLSLVEPGPVKAPCQAERGAFYCTAIAAGKVAARSTPRRPDRRVDRLGVLSNGLSALMHNG
jgi:hypothetical protein